jgi:hypothetical protein
VGGVSSAGAFLSSDWFGSGDEGADNLSSEKGTSNNVYGDNGWSKLVVGEGGVLVLKAGIISFVNEGDNQSCEGKPSFF